jgi:hypothetical protein
VVGRDVTRMGELIAEVLSLDSNLIRFVGHEPLALTIATVFNRAINGPAPG